jgi:hypothetical protein
MSKEWAEGKWPRKSLRSGQPSATPCFSLDSDSRAHLCPSTLVSGAQLLLRALCRLVLRHPRARVCCRRRLAPPRASEYTSGPPAFPRRAFAPVSVAAYIDHAGEVHDPDFRDFPDALSAAARRRRYSLTPALTSTWTPRSSIDERSASYAYSSRHASTSADPWRSSSSASGSRDAEPLFTSASSDKRDAPLRPFRAFRLDGADAEARSPRWRRPLNRLRKACAHDDDGGNVGEESDSAAPSYVQRARRVLRDVTFGNEAYMYASYEDEDDFALYVARTAQASCSSHYDNDEDDLSVLASEHLHPAIARCTVPLCICTIHWAMRQFCVTWSGRFTDSLDH